MQPRLNSAQAFFALTPDRVLQAVERSGSATTGLCYALNSLENRVYEVELEDGRRVVGKFYRPGRWSRATILDEHALLAALAAAELPVCAPLPLDGDETLLATDEGIWFALFPRMGGRALDELDAEGYRQLGRLISRIHNVAAGLHLRHRPAIDAASYGRHSLEQILASNTLAAGLEGRYRAAVDELCQRAEALWQGIATPVVHGDCHRGNLLARPEGWLFLDFDDMARAPAAQDLWLLLPARPRDCPNELEAMLDGYRQFRDFDDRELGLIEALRGLRYVRYAGWVASRWDDPAFRRAFPDWGSDRYWQGQLTDLHEQLRALDGLDGGAGW